MIDGGWPFVSWVVVGSLTRAVRLLLLMLLVYVGCIN